MNISAPRFIIPAKEEKGKRFPSYHIRIAMVAVAVVNLLLVLLLPSPNESVPPTDYLVIVNGKRITNPEKAREYAEAMFTQVCNIKTESFKPMKTAIELQERYNAARIIDEVKSLNNIKTTLRLMINNYGSSARCIAPLFSFLTIFVGKSDLHVYEQQTIS